MMHRFSCNAHKSHTLQTRARVIASRNSFLYIYNLYRSPAAISTHTFVQYAQALQRSHSIARGAFSHATCASAGAAAAGTCSGSGTAASSNECSALIFSTACAMCLPCANFWATSRCVCVSDAGGKRQYAC